MNAIVAGLMLGIFVSPAGADPARDAILAGLADQAKTANPAFAGFSADNGKTFFQVNHTGGKPDTPSCTSCHGKDPTQAGQTRAGKAIEPMAVSKTPSRFTDAEKVAKWLLRNSTAFLGASAPRWRRATS
jgi:hypothetical protein